ncbi:hypothetical protein ACSBR1_033153 [Camellia fascicularis]
MGIHDHHQSPVLAAKPKTQNKNIAKALYKALARGKLEIVAQLLATDLEWWYHGPPNCQHMMLLLTGKSRHNNSADDDDEFQFKPRSITSVADLVILEGWDDLKRYYWVHVWTIKDGAITQFREYFNTWLTVLLQVPEEARKESVRLWQSDPEQRLNRSLPDLMLAV